MRRAKTLTKIPALLLAAGMLAGLAAGCGTSTSAPVTGGFQDRGRQLFSANSLTFIGGPYFSWNILNYGRIRNNVRVQDARLQQLLENYQSTVLNAVNALPKVAKQLRDGTAGHLAISFVSTADYSVLPKLVRRYASLFPDVEISLTEATSDVQIAAVLISLRTKGETVPELVGLARTMRELATPVITERLNLVDTAGTGGGPSTFNVSTTAALVAAGAGCAMAKHGNRSSTSKSGSADLLEALGVNIELDAAGVGASIDEVGIGFMFAPRHHLATSHVMPVRKELAVRTVFNFLGPLTNPAGARRQVIGVADRTFQESIAEALVILGAERALVVSGDDGLDEISISGPTRVIRVDEGKTEELIVTPEDFGMEPASLEDVVGGSPQENAVATLAVFDGERSARRDLVLLNAAAAIYTSGMVEDLAAGVVAAADSIDSSSASRLLAHLVSFTADQ